MKIEKVCKKEIIQYETLDNHNLMKIYFDMNRIEKKKKYININQIQFGRKYHASTESVFDYLMNNEGYNKTVN